MSPRLKKTTTTNRVKSSEKGVRQLKPVEKTYRLTNDRSGLSFLLNSGRNGNLLSQDEKTGYNKPIRHCPNERSIYIEEQSEYAVVDPIILTNGYIHTKTSQKITQEFLDAHPSNTDNGGNIFEYVDEEMEAKEGLEREEVVLDVKQVVREKSKTSEGVLALRAVATVMTGDVNHVNKMGVNELKTIIYNEVESSPYDFINEEGKVIIFDDDSVFRKHLTLCAIKDGVIKKSHDGRAMLWRKENKVICEVPMSINPVDFFTEYLGTDEGLLVLEEIQKRS